MPEARIGGVGIHYSAVGEGDPLLLIMGFGMPGDAWMVSLPFLQGYRAIYFDNRGTGRSEAPEGPYTIAQMADDAAGILNHLRIDRAHVYGISMGGMIAQELALRYPRKVRSLVLGCTTCGGEHSTLGEPEVIATLFEAIQEWPARIHRPGSTERFPSCSHGSGSPRTRGSAKRCSRWRPCSPRHDRTLHSTPWPASSTGPRTTGYPPLTRPP